MTHKKIKKHIEIARSNIVALSSMGQKSGDALFEFLKTRFQTVGVSLIETEDDLRALVAKQPDLVFIGMKYALSATNKPIWISEYLESRGIAHTGSSHAALKLEQNKILAKQQVLDAGLATSPYIIVEHGAALTAIGTTMKFPLFVKPTDLGAGVGVDNDSVVHSIAELNAKTASIYHKFGTSALVERFLSGREFSVAILKRLDSSNVIAMPLELVPGPNVHGYRILSGELKSAPLETPVFPVLDPILRTSLMDLAESSFAALGARDFGRIDIRLDASGTPHFLEANLIPCLIRGSGNFPKACFMNMGLDYDAMILHIVQLAFNRATEADSLDALALGRAVAA